MTQEQLPNPHFLFFAAGPCVCKELVDYLSVRNICKFDTNNSSRGIELQINFLEFRFSPVLILALTGLYYSFVMFMFNLEKAGKIPGGSGIGNEEDSDGVSHRVFSGFTLTCKPKKALECRQLYYCSILTPVFHELSTEILRPFPTLSKWELST